VERPGPRAAHVLGTQDAERDVVLAERHIEHGAYAEAREIAFPKVERPGLGPRGDGRHHTFRFDRVEVRRTLVAIDERAAVVAAALAQVHADAAQRAARVAEPPHAEALDLQRLGARFQDAAEALVE